MRGIALVIFQFVCNFALISAGASGTAQLALVHPLSEADPLEEEVESDGDDDFEVVVRSHRHKAGELTSRRRRRVIEVPGAVHHPNASGPAVESAKGSQPSQQLQAIIGQPGSATALSPPSSDPGRSPNKGEPFQAEAPMSPGVRPNTDPATARGLELIIGILLGILLSVLSVGVGLWFGSRWRSKAQAAVPNMAALSPTQGQGLDGGRLGLVQFHYQDVFFHQLSWTMERGAFGARDRDRDYVTTVFNERSQKVARGVGRLMSTPNGEIYLTSLAGGPGSAWCVLKRPAPSRRPGQLWDFKVCQSNMAPYVEVRQRSETKCLVNDAVSQRRMMTVIGNFTYPVFLSGERSIHVWITQPDGQSCMGAQCEAKMEDPYEAAQYGGPAAQGALPGPPSRRFYVTTTADTDASLVLAVLLGLQDVHRAATRGDFPGESSSPSASSGWQGGRGGSGGSTAVSLSGRSESAKAAPVPPSDTALV